MKSNSLLVIERERKTGVKLTCDIDVASRRAWWWSATTVTDFSFSILIFALEHWEITSRRKRERERDDAEQTHTQSSMSFLFSSFVARVSSIHRPRTDREKARRRWPFCADEEEEEEEKRATERICSTEKDIHRPDFLDSHRTRTKRDLRRTGNQVSDYCRRTTDTCVLVTERMITANRDENQSASDTICSSGKGQFHWAMNVYSSSLTSDHQQRKHREIERNPTHIISRSPITNGIILSRWLISINHSNACWQRQLMMYEWIDFPCATSLIRIRLSQKQKKICQHRTQCTAFFHGVEYQLVRCWWIA